MIGTYWMLTGKHQEFYVTMTTANERHSMISGRRPVFSDFILCFPNFTFTKRDAYQITLLTIRQNMYICGTKSVRISLAGAVIGVLVF